MWNFQVHSTYILWRNRDGELDGVKGETSQKNENKLLMFWREVPFGAVTRYETLNLWGKYLTWIVLFTSRV